MTILYSFIFVYFIFVVKIKQLLRDISNIFNLKLEKINNYNYKFYIALLTTDHKSEQLIID